MFLISAFPYQRKIIKETRINNCHTVDQVVLMFSLHNKFAFFIDLTLGLRYILLVFLVGVLLFTPSLERALYFNFIYKTSSL